MKLIDLRDCPQHIPLLAEWHHAEWSYLHPDTKIDERIDRMQRYLVKDFIPTTWVCFDDDENVVGSVAIVHSDMDTRKELGPWLASVYVDESQRGKGLGKIMVQHVMDECRAQGIDPLYLFTPGQSAFYRKLGWVDHEAVNHNGTDVLIMRVDLSN